MSEINISAISDHLLAHSPLPLNPYLSAGEAATWVGDAQGGAGQSHAAHDVPLHEGVGEHGVREPHLQLLAE